MNKLIDIVYMRILNKLIDRFKKFDVKGRILRFKFNLFEKLSLHLSKTQQEMSPLLRLNFLMFSRDQLLSCLEKKIGI